MAEVKWQARRISDGVLVDVTGDTEGNPAVAPTPNTLTVGAGSGGVTVDNQSDPPAEITTIIAPAATISGDEATIPVQNIISLEATGANDAGFDYTAQVEDGTASFEVDCYSEGNQGAINLAAGGGAKSAVINMTASDGGGARIAVSAEELGFFDAAATPRPQVPASPTEQDIVDALVALGLITQAA